VPNPKPAAAPILLARHGETPDNAAGRILGRRDPPLSAAGVSQAERLGRTLADAGLVGLWTSPLQRASRTAELAGLTGQVEPDLVEWDYGPEEGRTTEQARETRPGWTVWDDTGLGESLDELAVRSRRVLDRVRPVLESGWTVRGEVLALKLREELVVITNEELTRVDTRVVVPPRVED